MGAARVPSGSRARLAGAEYDNEGEGEEDNEGAWEAQAQADSVLFREPRAVVGRAEAEGA